MCCILPLLSKWPMSLWLPFLLSGQYCNHYCGSIARLLKRTTVCKPSTDNHNRFGCAAAGGEGTSRYWSFGVNEEFCEALKIHSMTLKAWWMADWNGNYSTSDFANRRTHHGSVTADLRISHVSFPDFTDISSRVNASLQPVLTDFYRKE